MKRNHRHYKELSVPEIQAGKVSKNTAMRLIAAEEAMWGFTNAIALGLLNDIPMEQRGKVIEAIGYDEWADLAVQTGILPHEPVEEDEK